MCPQSWCRAPCTQRAPRGSLFGSFLLSSSLMPCSPTRKMQTAGAHWAGQPWPPGGGPWGAGCPPGHYHHAELMQGRLSTEVRTRQNSQVCGGPWQPAGSGRGPRFGRLGEGAVQTEAQSGPGGDTPRWWRRGALGTPRTEGGGGVSPWRSSGQ